HGIAGHAAEAARDLARAQPFGPELLQKLDALISPGHGIWPPEFPSFLPWRDSESARHRRGGSILNANAVREIPSGHERYPNEISWPVLGYATISGKSQA